MDLENSLITTWKDTQVLGTCLLAPITSGTPGLVGLSGGWATPSCLPWVPTVPHQIFGEGPSPT